MRETRVVVIGAGIGGLVAAALLAARGVAVTVLEKAAAPGGKMREVAVGPSRIDAGPTVFTLRPVFESIFAEAGGALTDHVVLRPAGTLARHAWSEGERLDLFTDLERSADAIGRFAGSASARGYRGFAARAEAIWRTLERSFIRDPAPTPLSLVRSAGLSGLPSLWRISPFATLWDELGKWFPDARLRQLFARYATYCGASPFAAPATLMLIAHVEREGVWLIEGGIHGLARALERVATRNGAVFRYGAEVSRILAEGGRARGVALTDGERIEADAVIANADASALAGGLFGGEAQRAVGRTSPARSLSAVTWSMRATAGGFPLLHHSVFFGNRYRDEFDDIFRHGRLPGDPTVYVCAQDRGAEDGAAPGGEERLFLLVNAPPTGDVHGFPEEEIAACAQRAMAVLERCGLRLEPGTAAPVATTPADFNRMFPATGGALYGPAQHGWRASFSRPTARTRLPGLYLAGGSVHPGAGVPMAALSGRMAAMRVLAALPRTGLASTGPSARAAMSGGTSMRSATTGDTG